MDFFFSVKISSARANWMSLFSLSEMFMKNYLAYFHLLGCDSQAHDFEQYPYPLQEDC